MVGTCTHIIKLILSMALFQDWCCRLYQMGKPTPERFCAVCPSGEQETGIQAVRIQGGLFNSSPQSDLCFLCLSFQMPSLPALLTTLVLERIGNRFPCLLASRTVQPVGSIVKGECMAKESGQSRWCPVPSLTAWLCMSLPRATPPVREPFPGFYSLSLSLEEA